MNIMKKHISSFYIFIFVCVLFVPVAAFAYTSKTISATVTTVSVFFSEIWNGGGYTSWSNGIETLSPAVATSPSETHSAFALDNTVLKQPYRVTFTLNTLSQLRTGSPPNPWEVGWFVFGYKPDGKFKYLILKPDGYGIELGESLLNNAQNFLWTSSFGQSSFAVGQPHNVSVTVQNNTITIVVDGKTYLTYKKSLKDVLDFNGRIGFYSEDALVQASNIKVTQLR